MIVWACVRRGIVSHLQLNSIQWTYYPFDLIDQMSIDHSPANIFMFKDFLHLLDIISFKAACNSAAYYTTTIFLPFPLLTEGWLCGLTSFISLKTLNISIVV